MTEVADGDVLSDRQLKVAAAGREHEAAFDGRGPYDLIVDKTMDVLKDRIAFVATAIDGRVRLSPQNESVRAIDAGEAQLAYRLRQYSRITFHVGRKRQDRIAGALTNTLNPASRIPLEDGSIFGKGDFARRLGGRDHDPRRAARQ